MGKHRGSVLLAIAVAALTVGGGPAQAAAGGWKVSPGGMSTASGTLTLSAGQDQIICGASWVITFQVGPGGSLGSITQAGFSNCTGSLSMAFTVTAGGLPWSLNGASYTSGVTQGSITGIHLALSGSDCSATVDGTSGTADNGTVKITYTNSTGKLALLPSGGNLHYYNVSGCLGLIGAGDSADLSGTLTLTPRQVITGP
jgi:hypothetical protein